MNDPHHLLPCQHLGISRSYISRMFSSGIVISIDPNGASTLLILLRHVSEFSRAMLATTVCGPIE